MKPMLRCLFFIPYFIVQGTLALLEFVCEPACEFCNWYEQL